MECDILRKERMQTELAHDIPDFTKEFVDIEDNYYMNVYLLIKICISKIQKIEYKYLRKYHCA